MRTKNITVLLSVLLSVMWVSCRDDNEAQTTGNRTKVAFSTGIHTRVDDAQWDIGDAIGIAMLDRETGQLVDNMYNSRYTTTSTAGDFEPGTVRDIMYFPTTDREVTFKSYYPYNAEVQSNLVIPVSVASQQSLPAIDFMSADHLSGYSKSDPNVMLDFHHRLSKVIFHLSIAEGVPNFPLADVTLTVKGMRTTGVYNLTDEALVIDDGSVSDIVIPRQSAANERVGIVLPRAAAEGVTFELTTPDGSTFIADMNNELELLSGYKYIFNVSLEGTEMDVSVNIQEWVDGGETSYDIVGVSAVAGESYGAVAGDEMQVYIRTGNQYEPLSLFTYGEDGRWTTANPVFWEDIEDTEVELRASVAPRQPAANETQMPDIMLSDELQVQRHTAAEFVVNHVGSRVTVELQSNVFTADELEAAVITLPAYLAGATEVNGTFVPGVIRRNILVDRQNPDDQFAIIQPQSITPGGAILNVNVGGRDLAATVDSDGFTYEAGTAYKLIAIVNESEVTVSARIVDWVDGGTTTYDILGVTTPVNETYGAVTGDQMQVYRRVGESFEPFGTFTYQEDGRWVNPTPVFWDDIDDNAVELRAALVPREPARNETQLPDILVADEQSVERNSGANFVFNHVGSRVTVVLQSNMFTPEELESAVITLPNYIGGGTEADGAFIPGNQRINVLVDRADENDNFAIIQPQPISSGGPMVNVNINGRNFVAQATAEGFQYEAGTAYRLVVLVNESEVTVSARIVDWVDGGTTTYDILGVTTPAGDSYGALEGDQMEVYLRTGNNFETFRTFTYGADGRWTTPQPVFWDELAWDPIELRASIVPREPARNETQLPDILISGEESVERNSGANFVFNHAGSRVAVVLRSNVFTAEQLAAAPITLPGYLMGGREENAVFIPGTTRGNIIVDKTDPQDQFAIIQPQSISPGGAMVTVNIGGRNFTARATDAGFLYEAGTSYQLIVMVNESDVSVSARVVDWAPADPVELTILEVTPTQQPTEGVDPGARMTIYRDTGDTYTDWATFTYAGNNIWRPDQEVYWEGITDDYVDLRASIIAHEKLHPAQIDDILIADDLRVAWGTGVDLVLRHLGSRVVVTLLSETFPAGNLGDAQITMSQHLTGGTEQSGRFVPGNTRQDIPLVRDADTNNGIAIIQPQTVAAGDNMFRVRIGTRDYWAKAPEGGFTYQAGVSYGIIIHVNENHVTVSTQVIPWTETEVTLQALTVGTTLPGQNSGINNGEQMNVYVSDGTDRNLLSTFTYNQAGSTWTASPTVYWESIAGTPSFYASILRQTRPDPTQLDDYLIAEPLSVADGQPLNFTLRHPVSRVTVQLRSSDNTFSPAELADMVITLPNYVTGGEHNNGLFEFPGDNPTGTINVPVVNNNATAFIRPQVVTDGPVVNITDPSTGRNYPVTSNTNISFQAGEATVLNIDMRKTAVGISANAIDWEEAATIPLSAPAITVTGAVGPTATFFQDRNIYAYKLGADFTELVYHYEPIAPGTYEWRGTQTLYWDDLNGQPLNITGVYYPEQATVPALSQANTTFAWNLPADQSGGYDQYDIMMSPLSLSSPAPVNFNFRHILSRVRVRIVTNAFTADELQDLGITLNNFTIRGSASITTGQATGTNSRSDVTPYTHTASQEYSALVMPQTIAANTPVVTVTLRDYQNVPFVGRLENTLTFVPGKENVITVTLLKTAIQISASLEEWTEGSTGSVTIQ